jgi:MFS family permease
MKNLIQNRYTLIFSLLLNFVSCFGQTFFISLFVVHFLKKFHISAAQFGLYYSALTLTGGLLIPQIAKHMETLTWRSVSLVIPLVLAASALLLSQSSHLPAFIVALFGLRLFGQGISGHMSAVCVVKNISKGRGSALSLSSIGYPMSEALMPGLCFVLLHKWGLEKTWMLFSVFLVAITPILYLFARRIQNTSGTATVERTVAIREVLKDKIFLRYLPAVLCAPFFMTGIFLYQSTFSEMKHWPVEHLSLALSGFALSRFLFSLFSGPLIDRIGAKRLFSFYLLPLTMALIILATMNQPWVSWMFMFIAGVSIGISGPIKSGLWTEIYGPQLHGRYRSVSSSFMVFSTAAAPFIFGVLIEQGVGIKPMLLGSALLIILASLLTLAQNDELSRKLQES